MFSIRLLLLFLFCQLAKSGFFEAEMEWAQNHGTNCSAVDENLSVNKTLGFFHLSCLTWTNSCTGRHNKYYFDPKNPTDKKICTDLLFQYCEFKTNLSDYDRFCCELKNLIPKTGNGDYGNIADNVLKQFCHHQNTRNHIDIGIFTESDRKRIEPAYLRKKETDDLERKEYSEKVKNESHVMAHLPGQEKGELFVDDVKKEALSAVHWIMIIFVAFVGLCFCYLMCSCSDVCEKLKKCFDWVRNIIGKDENIDRNEIPENKVIIDMPGRENDTIETTA